MKIIIIVPVRMGSKRLRGKILKKLKKFELLYILIKRLKKVKFINEIVISTTRNREDNLIIKYCRKFKINFFRGSSLNVAKRISDTASHYKAAVFIRINGDSPLIDYRIINKALKIFKNKNPDLVTNIFPRTFPIGQSVEIMKSKVLKENLSKFNKQEYKEHVSKFFYKNKKKFNIINLKNSKNYSKLKLAVDTSKDLNRLENLNLTKKNLFEINMTSIIRLLNEKI